MKISIRRNVFETNSSTNHTYTFSIKDASTKNERNVEFRTFNQKAALVDWLFEECYFGDDFIYMDGVYVNPYSVKDAKEIDENFQKKLYDLLDITEHREPDDLAKTIADRVTENESKFFEEKDFSYASKLDMQSWENIKSNLSQKERETLALKIALMILPEMGGLTDYISLFFRILDNKIDGDAYLELQSSTFNSQLIVIGKLHDTFMQEVKRISGKTIEQIYRKVGYVGIDGLLNDYYDFDVFSEQLGLNTSTYAKFVESLDKFLTEEDKIVVAD